MSTYTHLTLEKSEETLEFILNIISEGVWDWSALTGKVYRNPGWFKMLEYDINCFDETIHTWESIIHPKDYSRVMEHLESYITGKIDIYKIKYRCKKADGSYIWIEDNAKIVEKDKNGKVLRIIGAHTNIDNFIITEEKLHLQNELLLSDNKSLEQLIDVRTKELEKLNKELESKIEELEHSVIYDHLTNIYNRRMFDRMFELELNRAKRYSYPLSFILLDIDNFKKINDIYGHDVGDEVLINLSKHLKNNIRSCDTLARWGGEEFVMIFPNTTKEEAAKKAEFIRESIENMSIYKQSKITCSFGISEYIENDKLNTLFARIDKGLYMAKNNGKNKVCIN